MPRHMDLGQRPRGSWIREFLRDAVQQVEVMVKLWGRGRGSWSAGPLSDHHSLRLLAFSRCLCVLALLEGEALFVRPHLRCRVSFFMSDFWGFSVWNHINLVLSLLKRHSACLWTWCECIQAQNLLDQRGFVWLDDSKAVHVVCYSVLGFFWLLWMEMNPWMDPWTSRWKAPKHPH